MKNLIVKSFALFALMSLVLSVSAFAGSRMDEHHCKCSKKESCCKDMDHCKSCPECKECCATSFCKDEKVASKKCGSNGEHGKCEGKSDCCKKGKNGKGKGKSSNPKA